MAGESAIKDTGFQTVRRLTCPKCGRRKIVPRFHTGFVKCAGCATAFK